MKQIIIILLACMTFAAYGAIYINQNSNGSTEYTDTPSANSQKIDVPAVNATGASSAPAAPPTPGNPLTSGNNLSSAAMPTATYTSFEIISPKAEETLQNQPVVAVQMKVVPDLNAGDKIQVMVDNQPAGPASTSTYQELNGVARGTHTLSAAIINSQNQIVKQTSAITIYVHLNSAITSPAMQPPPAPPPKAG